MATSPPQILEEPVREYLRKHGEPIAQEIRLQNRGDDVRMSMMKAAYEQYDELPTTVTQWYDPDQNAIVIPLPEPEPDDDSQLDIDEFGE